jgi:predicted ATPase
VLEWTGRAGLGLCLRGYAKPNRCGTAHTPLNGKSTLDALRRVPSHQTAVARGRQLWHVFDEGGLIGELHGACPEMTVLVTRETLGRASEHRIAVAPLARQPAAEHTTIDGIEATAPSALFMAAARRRDSRFATAPVDAPVMAQICARIAGMPLALELGARSSPQGLTQLERELSFCHRVRTVPRRPSGCCPKES